MARLAPRLTRESGDLLAIGDPLLPAVGDPDLATGAGSSRSRAAAAAPDGQSSGRGRQPVGCAQPVAAGAVWQGAGGGQDAGSTHPAPGGAESQRTEDPP